MSTSPNIRLLALGISVCVGLASVGRPVQAAPFRSNNPKITQAVASAHSYLASKVGESKDRPEEALIALALLKSGMDKNSGPVRDAVQAINKKITDGVYKPHDKHIYEAGVDATLLINVDKSAYEDQLRAISKYVIDRQFSNGSWDYPKDSSEGGRGTNGDTSVVQYACLALWAAEDAGIDVPDDVWVKCAKWLGSAMNADGGYSYVPGTNQGPLGGASDLNMTFAGLGALLICARHLYPSVADEIYAGKSDPDKQKASANDEPQVAGLEKIDTSKIPTQSPAPKSNASISLSQIRGSLNRGKNWINTRFRPFNGQGVFPYYYFYTLERFGALSDVDKIAGADWYNACSQELIKRQGKDGGWAQQKLTSGGVVTSFAVLFFVRSTAVSLGRPTEPPFGGGLLTGGKGPPTEAVEAEKEPLPIESLIAALQDPKKLELEEVQAQFVEQIQTDQETKMALIGQTDRLKKLIKHPKAEVRKIAAFAIGRSKDLSMARHLIESLQDEDLGVIIEAQSGLCWLSRRFDGVGLPSSPLNDLPENVSKEERQAAIDAWISEALTYWGNWYLEVRPYSDRGDEFEAQLRLKIGK